MDSLYIQRLHCRVQVLLQLKVNRQFQISMPNFKEDFARNNIAFHSFSEKTTRNQTFRMTPLKFSGQRDQMMG